MQQPYEIKSSTSPYNMSPWCIEKMSNVIRDLAQLVEIAKDEAKTPEDTSKSLLSTLSSALHDATKILAFSCGAQDKWEPTDATIILKGGDFAYEQLAVKYGIIPQSTGHERIFEPKLFIVECRQLLQGPLYPGRSCIEDLLFRARFKEPLLKILGDKLEAVIMGEMDWDAFVSWATNILIQMEEKYNNGSGSDVSLRSEHT